MFTNIFDTGRLFNEHVRLDTDVTHRRTTVAEVDVDIIGVTDFGIRHKLIQVHIARSSKVSTAKVHSELVIDIDPNVIVTTEIELEALLETEVCMGFEAEVLVTTAIAPAAFLRFPASSRRSRSFATIRIERPIIRSTTPVIARPAKHAGIRT